MLDINTREDVELLVDEFYKSVLADEEIGPYFKSITELNWVKHIPIICDFWESILLGATNYSGNPMAKHVDLHKKYPMTANHFERWIIHWENAVKENFSGIKATEALVRAKSIKDLMKFKIEEMSKSS